MHANLVRARLVRANLAGAHLGADLQGADLTEARLCGADFTGYWPLLHGQDAWSFSQQTLTPANMAGASLVRADLRGAIFRDGIHPDVDLREVDLEGAVYDKTTRWPKGFDPRRKGAVYARSKRLATDA